MDSSSFRVGLDNLFAPISEKGIPTYSVSMPSVNIKYRNSVGKQAIVAEAKRVEDITTSLFLDVEYCAEKLLHIANDDLELLIMDERQFFELKIASVFPAHENDEKQYPYLLLTSNSLMFELLYESSLWYLRLDSILNMTDHSSDDWFWTPFPDLFQNLDKISVMQTFKNHDHVDLSALHYIPTSYKMMTDEFPRMHIPLGNDPTRCLSDFEDEPSSVIACALALLKSNPTEADPRPETKGVGISYSKIPSMGEDKYLVICHYVKQFRDLRNYKWRVSENSYLCSLSRCKDWFPKDGNSQSFFAQTLDQKFIIKEIEKIESDSFLKSAALYFKHMNNGRHSSSETFLLAKICGIYEVTRRDNNGGREVKRDFLVMENLMYDREILHQYDVKGLIYSPANDPVGILWNKKCLASMLSEYPVRVSEFDQRRLGKAIENEAKFLHSMNVNEFTLLLGMESDSRDLVCGIIDYLKPFS